jgi:hypothetical protein
MLAIRQRWREAICAALFAGLLTVPGQALLAVGPPDYEVWEQTATGPRDYEDWEQTATPDSKQTATLDSKQSATPDSEQTATLDSEQTSTEVCTGEKLGTAIAWYDDAEVAARIAKEQGKLVFLIQVSGNFAREEFT